MALVFLAVFTALSLAMAGSVNLSLRQSKNYRSAMDARLAAESGLSRGMYVMQAIAQEYWQDSQEIRPQALMYQKLATLSPTASCLWA